MWINVLYVYIYIYILSQGHTCMWSNHLHLLNHVFAQELSDAKKERQEESRTRWMLGICNSPHAAAWLKVYRLALASLSSTRCAPRIQGLLVSLLAFWHSARFSKTFFSCIDGATERQMEVLAHWQTVTVNWTSEPWMPLRLSEMIR